MKFMMRYVKEGKAGAFYYRRNGRYWGRLPGKPGSTGFAEAYERIHRTFESGASAPDLHGTMGALITAYLASAEFNQNLKPKTRVAYRYDADILRKYLGGAAVKDLKLHHILHLRDKFQDKPGKANTLVRTARVIFAWGMARGKADRNPADLKAANVKALRLGEHRPWSPAEIAVFRDRAEPHFVVAMELALYTGQRQGDVVRMRWDDIQQGFMKIRQEKTGKELWIPIPSPLAAALERTPKTALTIVTDRAGRPWRSANALALVFGREVKRLGLEVVFHGLRKTTAVMLAEADCTTKQIAAITGQSDQMVEHYTRQADQRKLASAAITKLERKTTD